MQELFPRSRKNSFLGTYVPPRVVELLETPSYVMRRNALNCQLMGNYGLVVFPLNSKSLLWLLDFESFQMVLLGTARVLSVVFVLGHFTKILSSCHHRNSSNVLNHYL